MNKLIKESTQLWGKLLSAESHGSGCRGYGWQTKQQQAQVQLKFSSFTTISQMLCEFQRYEQNGKNCKKLQKIAKLKNVCKLTTLSPRVRMNWSMW